MSFVSNESLKENGTQYIGIAARSGVRPYLASSSAARSSASGSVRNSLQAGGAPAGSGPAPGALSNAPLQLTERSPRTLIVLSARSWPALGTPTIIPYCCCTAGSDEVGSMRPNSIGGVLCGSPGLSAAVALTAALYSA